ncbi:MAG: hypothetical protein HC851_11560 [Acaryochloris sp. RU_4_1]|nr:hypothetical protein [Acaryochloris sp. RU_4_1]
MRFRFKASSLLVGGTLVLVSSLSWLSGAVLIEPVFGQSVDPQLVADAVYQQLPGLPQENQYLRKNNNKPATNSTLVSRLIQYHILVKGRSPLYRFDWKITLADYLGIYENIRTETYPGHAYLKSNPLESDRNIIQQLNRQQRLALTQALSDVYISQTPQQEMTTPQQDTSPSATPAQPPVAQPKPVPPPQPKLIPLPGSGSADLLKTPPAPAQPTSPQSTDPAPASEPQPTGAPEKLSF